MRAPTLPWSGAFSLVCEVALPEVIKDTANVTLYKLSGCLAEFTGA